MARSEPKGIFMSKKGLGVYLKWVGGKRRIADRIASEFGGARLIEPFCGSASVSVEYARRGGAVGGIHDTNADLMLLHRSLLDGGEQFIEFASGTWDAYCARGLVDERAYYTIRDLFNTEAALDEWVRAATFLWLNKHGYNGLARYNRKGEYNVPKGVFSSDPQFPLERMREFSRLMPQDVTVTSRPFDETMTVEATKRGDVIYCDPPYIQEVANGFSAYSRDGFTADDHTRLARSAAHMARNGRKVVVSNSDTDLTRTIYSGGVFAPVTASRSVSCDPKSRGKKQELLIVYGC